MSNLKACGVAFALYADLYQGRCPVDEKMTLIGSYQLITNVVQTAKVLFCPSDARLGARPEADFSKLTTDNVSYSYVPNLLWNDGGKDVILWLDRIYTTERGDKWPADGNHRRAGGNVAFTDGHAGFFTELPANLRDNDSQAVVLSP